MKHQTTHKSSSRTPATQEKRSHFAPRPFAVQAQPDSQQPATQETIENEALQKDKLEAFGLQLQAKRGTIAPIAQARLGVLQAKMQDFQIQSLERASQFGHSLSNIAVHAPVESPLQAKLTIGAPGDKYEQEADRVAAQVVRQINAPVTAPATQGQSVQRQDEREEKLQAKPSISHLQRSALFSAVHRDVLTEEKIQAQLMSLQRREAIGGGEASSNLESAINSARGSGKPLDAGLQQAMGQAMGANFSGVRVHADAQSDQLNRSIQARAFTTGQDVFFRQGAYQPESRSGQELIAHELTHVVQQGGVPAIQQKQNANDNLHQNQISRELRDSPTGHSQLTIQRDLDEDIITDELTTKCCYRSNSSLEPLLAAIRTYNQANNLKNLGKVIKRLGQIPLAKQTKYKQPLDDIQTEIEREQRLLYLQQDHKKIPEGVNDAKDYEDSITNCALTSVGALLGLRVSDIVGKEKGEQQAFFVNYEADRLGEKRPQKQSQTGSYGDKQVEMQKSGIKNFVMGILNKAGVELENDPHWQGKDDDSDESADTTLKEMSNYPPGTRYIVYASKKLGGAHFVYAEHIGTGVKFYDYQRDILYKRIKYTDTDAYKEEEGQAKTSGIQYYKNAVAAKGKRVMVDPSDELDQPPGPEVYDKPITVNYSNDATRSPNGIGNPTSIDDADEVSFIAFVIKPPAQAKSKNSL